MTKQRDSRPPPFPVAHLFLGLVELSRQNRQCEAPIPRVELRNDWASWSRSGAGLTYAESIAIYSEPRASSAAPVAVCIGIALYSAARGGWLIARSGLQPTFISGLSGANIIPFLLWPQQVKALDTPGPYSMTDVAVDAELNR